MSMVFPEAYIAMVRVSLPTMDSYAKTRSQVRHSVWVGLLPDF